MAVVGGVNCYELVEGLIEGVREGGPYAQKKYLCDWNDRYQLANSLLGLVSSSGSAVIIAFPLPYPQSSNMLAREVEIEGVGIPTQGPVQLQFPYARVTVHYAVPQWNPVPNPQNSLDPAKPYVYATQEIEFGREFVNVEASSVMLANGHSVQIPYSFPIPHAILRITLNQVPYLPANLILEKMVAHINSTSYLGADPGFLKFDGATTSCQSSTDGTYTQNITYTFAFRPIAAWDEAFDPDGTSGWQQVQDLSGNPLVQRSDLSVLIPAAYGGDG